MPAPAYRLDPIEGTMNATSSHTPGAVNMATYPSVQIREPSLGIRVRLRGLRVP